MNEQQIQEQLKQNLQKPDYEEPTPTLPPPPEPTDGIPSNIELDELTQYKLHDLFGQPYQQHDEVSRQRLNYIYKEVSKMTDSSDYGFVASRISELQRIIGISNSNDRLYRLYQWLKLNNVRKNTEAEMESLRGVDSDVSWRAQGT